MTEKRKNYSDNPTVMLQCRIWVSFMEISLLERAYPGEFSESLHASKEITTKAGMEGLFFVSSHAHIERTSLCLWRQASAAKGIFSWQNSSGTWETGSKCHMFSPIISICHS